MPTPRTRSGDDTHAIDAGRYRSAVDRGLTGDKIPVSDPAAAPVHTDAEAGDDGTPRAASAAATRAQEIPTAPEQVRTDYTNPGRSQMQIPERSMAWLMGFGFAVLMLLGLMAAVVTLP
jgi:hypothetical protein